VYSGTSANNAVPFNMLPSLGGQDTLRGYDDYRFHDADLLLASIESRWSLLRDLDIAAFIDAGNVADRAGALNLHKRSWGAGVRVHSRTATLGRIDVAHSIEGWHIQLRFNDPFSLTTRLSRRTANAPFVP
jgi:outer membrane protein assembly factor BamA